jgi:hypothetical protein
MCYPTCVKKTSVYLTEAEVDRLAWLAEREGISQAEVIRKAIGAYTPERLGDRNFLLARSGEGPGGSIADVPEEELLRGFGE